jgi:hypothetical protein
MTNKWDRKVSAKELLIAENGSLKLLNGYAEIPEFALSDAATAQLCQKLEIPVRYYRKSDPGQCTRKIHGSLNLACTKLQRSRSALNFGS